MIAQPNIPIDKITDCDGNSIDGILGCFLLFPELGIRIISGDTVVPIKSRITGLSSSISRAVINYMSEHGEYRITGCAVYNIYNVIFRSYRRFVNPAGAWIWDILP